MIIVCSIATTLREKNHYGSNFTRKAYVTRNPPPRTWVPCEGGATIYCISFDVVGYGGAGTRFSSSLILRTIMERMYSHERQSSMNPLKEYDSALGSVSGSPS